MPVQVQQSSLAAKLGGRLSAAAAEHKDKPIDTGFQRLPPGIKQGQGIAKLQVFGWFVNDKEKGSIPKGEQFCRASAVVLRPLVHNNVKTAGMQTSQFTSLALNGTPASQYKPATTFSENFAEFVNLLKWLSNGSMVCQENDKTDPTGVKTEAFYKACMKQLTNPQNPVYISFSTREWKSPKKLNETQEQFDKREPMLIENWHGLATPEQIASISHNPAYGVNDNTNTQPDPTDTPPNIGADGLANNIVGNGITNSQIHAAPTDEQLEEMSVFQLVEIAMNDKGGATEEGAAAITRLQELAWENGWTEEQTDNADDWEQVGNMAMGSPSDLVPGNEIGNIGIGSKWKFAKRDKDGVKLKNGKGEEFPSKEVEIITLDLANQTCTVKTCSDGKDVVDIKKKPIHVKFDWLE